MNAKAILDLFLESGQELFDKGKGIADDKLGVPKDPEGKESMLSGAGKGALAAGALAMLLGTGAGRKLTGATVKLGSLAAISGVAYKAYGKWQSQQSGAAIEPGEPVSKLSGNAMEKRAISLLKAMIASAKADGHIDDSERANIKDQIDKLALDSDAIVFLQDELKKPLDIKSVAAGADSPEAAAEIYLVSRMVIDLDNEQERAYLKELAEALSLAPELVAQLESDITSG